MLCRRRPGMLQTLEAPDDQADPPKAPFLVASARICLTFQRCQRRQCASRNPFCVSASGNRHLRHGNFRGRGSCLSVGKIAFGTGQDALALGRFGPTRFQQGASYRLVCYRTDSAARVIYKGISNVGPTQGGHKVGREGTPGSFMLEHGRHTEAGIVPNTSAQYSRTAIRT